MLASSFETTHHVCSHTRSSCRKWTIFNISVEVWNPVIRDEQILQHFSWSKNPNQKRKLKHNAFVFHCWFVPRIKINNQKYYSEPLLILDVLKSLREHKHLELISSTLNLSQGVLLQDLLAVHACPPHVLDLLVLGDDALWSEPGMQVQHGEELLDRLPKPV